MHFHFMLLNEALSTQCEVAQACEGSEGSSLINLEDLND
jgi:hypothetical protein